MSAGRCPICGAESTTGHVCVINITEAARAILRPPFISHPMDVRHLTRESVALRAIAEDAIQALAEAGNELDERGYVSAARLVIETVSQLRARLEEVNRG